MNRWQALVEVTRILCDGGRPGLALTAIFVIGLPMLGLAAMLAYLLR